MLNRTNYYITSENNYVKWKFLYVVIQKDEKEGNKFNSKRKKEIQEERKEFNSPNDVYNVSDD